MLEPLLDRVRDLERANRRWKTCCAILGTVLVAILISGGTFVGIHGFRSLTLHQRRAEEVAREQAILARQLAEQALQEAHKQAKKD